MYRLNNIKIRENISNDEVLLRALKKFNIPRSSVDYWRIYKKSIDARDKNDVHFVYTIDIECKDKKVCSKLTQVTEIDSVKIEVDFKSNFIDRPVVVGAGPAGLFAAYTLAKNGHKPILIEQGKTVEERQKDVELFKQEGKINTLSNVQFGEGGAGTFSDGKLTTGVNDPYCKKVLEIFQQFGAPEQILYINKPHIGTDNLVNIVRNMREEIVALGGEVWFETKFVDFEIAGNEIINITLKNTKTNETKQITTKNVILAIGHSARDTFEKLYEKQVEMRRKNFSVGVRIEHKQEMINKSQYGDKTKLDLPAAEYKLVYHGENRSCYTFCMCPGGEVVASSSEEGTIVTNGMSKFARDGENANSAILVNVVPEDFEGDSPLAGIYFQKELEEKAFVVGGKNYYAPIQRVEDFLNNKKSEYIGEIKPSYKPGVMLSNLNDLLPNFVSETLREGIKYFDTKIKGFANPDAILTGVETRSSSPVTIVRNDAGIANIKGIYPCGEGAGYAGGIMTAAVDGIKCAIKIMENNKID